MRLKVSTPSRLHFGLIDLAGDLGRIFGSVGLAIDRPRVEIIASDSERFGVVGDGASKVTSLAKRFMKHYRLEPKCLLEILSIIPEHVGLGSGTQLALAVATVLSRIYGLKLEIAELARVMNRLSISNIGVTAFERGGFIIDAGYKTSAGVKKVLRDMTAPIIFRQEFPQEWRLVVAIPSAIRGLSGRSERFAFKKMPATESKTADKICRIILMKMIPSLIEKDIVAFGDALTNLQIHTGSYFKPIQGGVFGSKSIERCVEYMLKEGAYGAGQSSWGPASYGIVQGDKAGSRLKSSVKALLQDMGGGEVFTACADNQGAKVYQID